MQHNKRLSIYFKTNGGAHCYPEDIQDFEVNAYRQKYGIANPCPLDKPDCVNIKK